MELRQLGRDGPDVPILTFGTATFGGVGRMFNAWGSTDIPGARRLINICLDAGVTLFDCADNYSGGLAEEILGEALVGRPRETMVATKTSLPVGDDPGGSSYDRIRRQVEGSLRRLRRDHIDVLQLHARDAATPIEETLAALDDLVRAGTVRHIGVSNFAGWELMKSLAVADRMGVTRYCAHQVYYSLLGRDYEWELMPLGLAEGVGAMVWSPLGWGRLTGKIRRGISVPPTSRLGETADSAPPVADEHTYRVVDVLSDLAAETCRSIPQIAINWLLQRPSVSTVVIGARTEEQLRDNLGAVGWSLTPEQIERLDAVSSRTPPYPYYLYWRAGGFNKLNPPPVNTRQA